MLVLDTYSSIEKKKALEELMENKAFLYLNSIMQSQVDALQQDVLFSPCSNIDSLVSQEYKKGQLEGRLSWVKTLETTVESLAYDIHIQSEREESTDVTDARAAALD